MGMSGKEASEHDTLRLLGSEMSVLARRGPYFFLETTWRMVKIGGLIEKGKQVAETKKKGVQILFGAPGWCNKV